MSAPATKVSPMNQVVPRTCEVVAAASARVVMLFSLSMTLKNYLVGSHPTLLLLLLLLLDLLVDCHSLSDFILKGPAKQLLSE